MLLKAIIKRQTITYARQYGPCHIPEPLIFSLGLQGPEGRLKYRMPARTMVRTVWYTVSARKTGSGHTLSTYPPS